MFFNLLDAAPAAAADPASAQGAGYTMLIVYAVIIAAFYFILIRPQSKKKKQEAEMRNNLEIGDEITTIGGIMGRVVSIKDDDSDSLVIETSSDRSHIRIKRWAISSIDTVKETPVAKKAEGEKKSFFGRKKKAEENNPAEK